MTRSRLKSVYLKNQNITGVISIIKEILVLIYYEKQNLINKRFWKNIKPFFSDTGLASNNIVLKEKGNLITDKN